MKINVGHASKPSTEHENIFSIFNFYFFFTDERDRVQKKTFTKWINQHLMKVRTHSCIPVPSAGPSETFDTLLSEIWHDLQLLLAVNHTK